MKRCLICNKKLKSKISIEIGIGPKCLKRLIDKANTENIKKPKVTKQGATEAVEGQLSMF